MKRLIVVVLCAIVVAACGKPAAAPSGEAGAKGAATGQRCPNVPEPDGPPEAAQMVVQDGHSLTINAVALSGDGSLLASSSIDGALCLWDTRTGLLFSRMVAPGAPDGLGIDHAGKRIAYAHAEIGQKPHAVRVKRLADGHEVELPKGPFALASNGAAIAIGTRPIQIFDTTKGAAIRSFDVDTKGAVRAVALNQDATRLAVAIATTVVVFDAGTGAQVRRVDLEDEPTHPSAPPSTVPVMSAVYELAFVGETVLMTRGTRKLQVLQVDGTVRTLTAPKGQTAVARGNLWIATEGSSLQRIEVSSGRSLAEERLVHKPFRIAVSPDGGSLALAYMDPKRGSSIELRDVASRRVLRTIEGRDTRVYSLAMTADGKQLAVGAQATITQWAMPRGEMWFSTPDRRIRSAFKVAYDASGRQLAAVEFRTIRIREAATGRLLRSWRMASLGVVLLAFRPNSSLLLTVDEDGIIEEWDLSGKLPDAVAVDADRTFRDLNRPRPRRIGKVGFGVTAAALSPDGGTIAVSATGTHILPHAGAVALVDSRSGEKRWRIESPSYPQRWLGFTADGQRVLLSSFDPLPTKPQESARKLEPLLRAFSTQSGALQAEVSPGTGGPLAARGGFIIIGGNHPVILDAKSLKTKAAVSFRDVHALSVAAHPQQEAFLLGGYGGATALVTTTGELRALLVSTLGGDYIATTPDGAYRASLDGARSLAWTFDDPREAFSFEQFASRYEQPEQVARRLAGGSAPRLPAVSRPPRLEVQGARKRKAAGATAGLRATVSSRRQVDRVRVFANGRLAAEQLVCAPEAEVDLDVPLQPGDNRLAVIAYDSEGYSSNPTIVDVKSGAKGSRPELWILTIGVSRYPKLDAKYQLEFADDDARSMAKALAALAGPKARFSKAHRTMLIDEQVTVGSIRKAVATLHEMKPDDLAVVFLAGHGLRLDDGKMHFLTHQAKLSRSELGEHALGWDHLEQALAAARGRVVLLLDACHSGHVSTEPIAPNEALAQALAAQNRTGVLVFAASRGSQLSYEVGGGKGPGARGLELAWDGRPPRDSRGLASNHGLFTSAMLEALAGKAPDRDDSDAIELGEFVDYVTERVRGASNGQQTPWVARRELFGDFALAPAGK